MNKGTAELYSFLVINTTLASDSLRDNIKTNQCYLMIRLEMKNYNMILTENLQKYQHYHQLKLINMKILQVKKYYFLMKVE